MKICLFIYGLTINYCANAQQGGYANSYPLSEKLGLQGSNWTDINQCADGSLVVKANSLPYWHVATNQKSEVHFGKSMQKVNLGQMFGFSGKGTWYSSEPYLIKRQADSFQVYDDRFDGGMSTENGMLLYNPLNKGSLQYFNGSSFYKIPLPASIAEHGSDSIFTCRDMYSGRVAIAFLDTDRKTVIFTFNEAKKNLDFVASYTFQDIYSIRFVFGPDSIIITKKDFTTAVLRNTADATPKAEFQPYLQPSRHASTLVFSKNGVLYLKNFTKQAPTQVVASFDDKLQGFLRDNYYNSYYLGGPAKMVRIFPHITQYPKLYRGSNSNANHTIMQNDNGDVYIGSYNGGLSKISSTGNTYIQFSSAVLPGGLGLGNTINFFTEGEHKLVQSDSLQKISSISLKNQSGFYITQSRDKQQVYASFAGSYSFGISSIKSLLDGKPGWKYIDSTKGVKLINILTLAEDPTGRIWFGRTSQGWGVYYPDTDKAATFLMQQGSTSFGVGSSFCDSYGTVWMGGDKGLWFANGNKPGSISPKDAQRFNHPLLANDVLIGSMKQWSHYLVCGAGLNLMLLDLIDFNKQTDKTKTKVRYLNPQELNLTSGCEQNTMLIDNRDSNLWLATSDNVYNIDLHTWFKQPVSMAIPIIEAIGGTDTFSNVAAGQPFTLKPTSNSLNIMVQYQTTDNMPRYLQAALVARGDTIRWSPIGTDNIFKAYNKQNGDYIFYVRILQQDGSIATYSFPFTIQKFLWQQLWFWLLISLGITATALYLFDLKSKKQLAQAEAKQVKAEAETLRSEQNRQLAKMQVASLSNQFRPHFILNALNTVGAQLYDKPEVDAVLGQLGDSIGIIFKNAQAGSIAHPLSEEWRLVESVIIIKQMEYSNEVQVHIALNGKEVTMHQMCGNSNSSYINTLTLCGTLVPMGIVQIPVENALIHGLRNKETGLQNLWIEVADDDSSLKITVTDNGIGRKVAALISNYRKNGVGTKNLQAVIELLNQYNTEKMSFHFEDEVFEINGEKHGTRVVIVVPKDFNYKIVCTTI